MLRLGLFTENEEHMIPSSRDWERRMFETKGNMTREELDTFFEGGAAVNGMDEHGDDWEHGGHNHEDEEVKNVIEEDSKVTEGDSNPLKMRKDTIESKLGKKTVEKGKEGVNKAKPQEKSVGTKAPLKDEKKKSVSKSTVEVIKLEKPRMTPDVKAKNNPSTRRANGNIVKSESIQEKEVPSPVDLQIENKELINIVGPVEVGIEIVQEASYN